MAVQIITLSGYSAQTAGGGAAMSLMQPTTFVYIWQRIE